MVVPFFLKNCYEYCTYNMKCLAKLGGSLGGVVMVEFVAGRRVSLFGGSLLGGTGTMNQS
jgi:hypothetical protein